MIEELTIEHEDVIDVINVVDRFNKERIASSAGLKLVKSELNDFGIYTIPLTKDYNIGNEFLAPTLSALGRADGWVTYNHSKYVAMFLYAAHQSLKDIKIEYFNNEDASAIEKLINTPTRQILIAGLLHDAGKILIPNEILIKPGKLNANERSVIKKHPVYGYIIINRAQKDQKNKRSFDDLIFNNKNDDLELAKYVAYCHHYRPNKYSYPDRFNKRTKQYILGSYLEEIPTYALIAGAMTALADVQEFHTVLSGVYRSYHPTSISAQRAGILMKRSLSKQKYPFTDTSLGRYFMKHVLKAMNDYAINISENAKTSVAITDYENDATLLENEKDIS